MGSAEAAELTKLAETTYRDVNIALANEFARFADRAGIDIDRVIDAANSQPFSHIHRPGIAVGGHCIPVYPRFYLVGDPQARIPPVSRAINDSMPAYAVDLLERALERLLAGVRVLILGVSYRGDVKEPRSQARSVCATTWRDGSGRARQRSALLGRRPAGSRIRALGRRPGRRRHPPGRPRGLRDAHAGRRARRARRDRRPRRPRRRRVASGPACACGIGVGSA